jgi:hypothetical protein
MPNKRAPFQRTIPGGTDTSEGFIPHKINRWGYAMPVAIIINHHPLALPRPVRYGKAYEWVMPGGRRYVE